MPDAESRLRPRLAVGSNAPESWLPYAICVSGCFILRDVFWVDAVGCCSKERTNTWVDDAVWLNGLQGKILDKKEEEQIPKGFACEV